MSKNPIDFDRDRFKKSNGEEIQDIVSYVTDFYKKGEDVKVVIGCDSKQQGRVTIYSLVVVLYDDFLHSGAHVVSLRIVTSKERDLFTRMMNEAVYSLNLSMWLDEKLVDVKTPKYRPNNYDGSIPFRKVEVHVDVNPNANYKSNIAYSAIMGMLCGSGFSTKSKYNNGSYAASSAADFLAK